ncbi:hypothetical protein FRB90_011431 [Tulasnella sp. 427]|nr:hypothetical protein FRB90_011431 [Tulasnella sp. 427]
MDSDIVWPKDLPPRPTPRPQPQHPDHLVPLLWHTFVVDYRSSIIAKKTTENVVQDIGDLLPGVEPWIEDMKKSGNELSLNPTILVAYHDVRHQLREKFICRKLERGEEETALGVLQGEELSYEGSQWVAKRRADRAEKRKLETAGGVSSPEEKASGGLGRAQTGGHQGRKRRREETETGGSELKIVEARGSSKKPRVTQGIFTEWDRQRWIKWFASKAYDVKEFNDVVVKEFYNHSKANKTSSLSQWIQYLKQNKTKWTIDVEDLRRRG